MKTRAETLAVLNEGHRVHVLAHFANGRRLWRVYDTQTGRDVETSIVTIGAAERARDEAEAAL